MQQTTVEATRHKFASQYTAPHKRDNFYKCFNLNLRKTAFAQQNVSFSKTEKLSEFVGAMSSELQRTVLKRVRPEFKKYI